MMGDWMALMVASVVGAALAWGLLLLRPSSDAAIDELYDTEVVERCVMAHLMSDPRAGSRTRRGPSTCSSDAATWASR